MKGADGAVTAHERDPRILALSLVSHTNVGKTTLARTLLRADIGEVLDQAHVTEENEVHTLVETPAGERLELWDTPGLGDSARLLRRLEREDTKVGWLLSQVWDRFSNRPLWCSQQALKNARDVADAVLYLVNAGEDPGDAGYVDLEMRILAWLGRPVIVLLNQTGGGRSGELARADRERWSAWLREHHPIVADVLDLDAFSRCWVQEGFLLEAVGRHLPPERRALLERLLAAWTAEQRETFEGSMLAVARHLARAAADDERVPPATGVLGTSGRKQAIARLGERLEQSTRALGEELLRLHGLEGEAASGVRARVEDFVLPPKRVEPWKAGTLGGVVSGALGGLAADILSGGLTFGGGFVAGAILGAFGSAGIARALSIVRGEKDPRAGWSTDFLDVLARQALLRYLAVAHFGRGHGAFREDIEPTAWRAAVEGAFETRKPAFARAWKNAARLRGKEGEDAARAELNEELLVLARAMAREVLARFYPDAGRFL